MLYKRFIGKAKFSYISDNFGIFLKIGQILAKIADIAESPNEAYMAIYGHMKVMSTNSNVLKLSEKIIFF